MDCKKKLLDSLMHALDPIRERYERIVSRKREIIEKLDSNAAVCREVAEDTIRETKEKMGLKRYGN